MAREASELLRKCPTCSNPVISDIGLRDFKWMDAVLPGRIGGMDLDCVLAQSKTGRMLILEFKRPGEYLSLGARLTYAQLVKAGYDVLIVWEGSKGDHKVAPVNKQGRAPFVTEMSTQRLADEVRQWWFDGLGEKV